MIRFHKFTFLYLNYRKLYKVFILIKELFRYDHHKSLAKTYMNRFSIEENDQFEIHVKDYSSKPQAGKKDMYNAVETVTLKAQQGSG